jgi:hypothetical protein
MRRFTRNPQANRKSDEITETPERPSSSRVQGKEKMGRQDKNRYDEFVDDDDDEDDEAAGQAARANMYLTGNNDQDKPEGKKVENKKTIHPMFTERRSKFKKPVKKSVKRTTKPVKENPKTVLLNPDQLPLSTPNPSVSHTEPEARNNMSLGKLRLTAKEKTNDNSRQQEAKPETDEGRVVVLDGGEEFPPTTRRPSKKQHVTRQ